jgi:hypothetical protein
MDPGEFHQVQVKIGLVAQVTAMIDLSGFLAEIELLDAVGAIVAPSEWIAAVDGARQWKAIATALLEFQRVTAPAVERAKAREQTGRGGNGDSPP